MTIIDTIALCVGIASIILTYTLRRRYEFYPALVIAALTDLAMIALVCATHTTGHCN
jgi:hypothetical protein